MEKQVSDEVLNEETEPECHRRTGLKRDSRKTVLQLPKRRVKSGGQRVVGDCAATGLASAAVVTLGLTGADTDIWSETVRTEFVVIVVSVVPTNREANIGTKNGVQWERLF